jgi:hypothetical protein
MHARSALAFALLWSTTSLAQSVIDAPPPKPREKSRIFTEDAVKKKGLELKKVVDADLDGDGRKENLGAALGKNGLQLVLIGEDKAGAVVAQVLPPVGGREIARFEAVALAPPASSSEIVFEVYDETPDEKVKRVRIYGSKDGRVVELFTNVIHRAKDAEARDEVDRDKSIVAYGEARAGWTFEDVDDDGSIEILVRRKPQILRLKKDDGTEAKLLTGVREEVWRFDSGRYAFSNAGERLRDFLPAHDIAAVKASSAWIEPGELKALRADALQKALLGNDKGAEQARGGDLELGLEDLDGTRGAAAPAAGDKGASKTDRKVDRKVDRKAAKKGVADGAEATRGKKGSKGKAGATDGGDEPPAPEIEIDRTPYIQRAADRNLATAWVEDDEKTDGEGQWLEFELAEPAAIHMVRVVGGCVDTQASFAAFNVPEKFKLSLDGGSDAVINRREPERFNAPAVAFADHLVKIKDRPWAKTTLVFFDGKTTAKKVRLTLGKALAQGKGNRTCISEVSIH